MRVYAVAPGYLPGGLNDGVPEKVLAMMAKKTNAGLADVVEVAKTIVDMAENISDVPPGSSVQLPHGIIRTL